MGVLDKAVGVLAALGDGPLSLVELMAATGLPRATAHRLASALEVHGLVRRDTAGRFALGGRLVELGRMAAGAYPLAAEARPVLEALRDLTGESVQLYVPEGAGRRCVVSLQSPHGLRWIVAEGALLPMDRGSAGKVFRGVAGWAESVEEREVGVCSVSAGVSDKQGNIVAAVSVSGPVERLSRHPGKRFGSAVLEAAARLSSYA